MRRLPPHPVNAAAVIRLRSLISQLSPAVVHGHASIGGALGRLAAAGSRVPALYSPHSLEPAQHRLAGVIELGLRPFTSRLVAVSASEAEVARKMHLVAPERIAVIPNGVDLGIQTSRSRSALGLGGDVPLVGMVARLAPPKDPLTFLAACALVGDRLPDAHFALVGDGPLRASVEAAARQTGLGHRLHHLAGVTDAAALVGGFDVFVLSSAFEGGPYAPLEAMRAGVPVVLTDAVGNRDVVEPGISGELVPPGDAAALAAAVIRLLEDAPYRGAVIDAAGARLRERFDVKQMGESLGALYRELAQKV
jgi:glycosyltransferase involved in cell wall biosynthesis